MRDGRWGVNTQLSCHMEEKIFCNLFYSGSQIFSSRSEFQSIIHSDSWLNKIPPLGCLPCLVSSPYAILTSQWTTCSQILSQSLFPQEPKVRLMVNSRLFGQSLGWEYREEMRLIEGAEAGKEGLNQGVCI